MKRMINCLMFNARPNCSFCVTHNICTGPPDERALIFSSARPTHSSCSNPIPKDRSVRQQVTAAPRMRTAVRLKVRECACARVRSARSVIFQECNFVAQYSSKKVWKFGSVDLKFLADYLNSFFGILYLFVQFYFYFTFLFLLVYFFFSLVFCLVCKIRDVTQVFFFS